MTPEQTEICVLEGMLKSDVAMMAIFERDIQENIKIIEMVGQDESISSGLFDRANAMIDASEKLERVHSRSGDRLLVLRGLPNREKAPVEVAA